MNVYPIVLFVVTALSACLPYALPPASGAVAARHTTAAGARMGLHAELGFSPFQLSEQWLRRRFDLTLAGTYDHGQRASWGASVALGPVLHPWSTSARVAVRVAPQLVGGVTTDGEQAGIRLGLERMTFASGFTTTRKRISHHYGELGFGGFLEAGMVWPDRRDREWSFVAGLSFRLPAMVGIACCIGAR